ncbi:MAG: response regulator transcription factor [Chloroflexota bacterium]
MNALLFAPEANERAILTLVLQRSGLTSYEVNSLEEIIARWPDYPIDLIVLVLEPRVSLPQIRQLRSQAEIPILCITEVNDEAFMIDLLESGVDMVVPRPFSARLLIAQVRALLRHTGGLPYFGLPTLSRAGVVLDPSTRTVQVINNPPNRLTQLEFRLLYALMTNAGQAMPAETLVERVWGYSGQGERELVRGLVRRLRQKIEPNPKKPQHIITIPGIGYLFSKSIN